LLKHVWKRRQSKDTVLPSSWGGGGKVTGIKKLLNKNGELGGMLAAKKNMGRGEKKVKRKLKPGRRAKQVGYKKDGKLYKHR